MYILLAAVIGVIAGLRAMVAPAAVSWAAWSGALALSSSWLAFFGYRWTPVILTVAVIGELVSDQLPGTPSRKVPPQFGARLVSGALSGAAIGVGHGSVVVTILAGVVGAVVGTLVGSAARGALARSFGRDRPAAIIEDVIALGLALAVAAAV